jgi:hypothetical protein
MPLINLYYTQLFPCHTRPVLQPFEEVIPASDVLAHRGIWYRVSDQNSPRALRAALEQGFGLETDVRDHLGELVISHDMPDDPDLTLADVLSWVLGVPGLIALNIKADGLGQALKNRLEPLAHPEIFAFDMSLPQARTFSNLDLPIAARVSEFESIQNLKRGPYASSAYLWIDCFDSDWFLNDETLVEALIGRTGILVSPEIHGRDFMDGWFWIRDLRSQGYRVGLCTDYPLEFMAWQVNSSST